MPEPLYAAYGGGVDSTAATIGLLLRGIKPLAIGFSDTKTEGPWVLDYVQMFSAWLVERGFPEITILQYDGGPSKDKSLEAECLRTKALPSLAYGFRSCSDKWKQQPQRKFVASQSWAQETWKAGGKVRRVIGFDTGEIHRAVESPEPRYTNYYPLIEWRMFRDDCRQLIKYAGLPIPKKSACFFCPSMGKEEVRLLSIEHNDLYQRALRVEDNAELTTIKGLGRNWSWKETVGADRGVEIACMCFDGDSDS